MASLTDSDATGLTIYPLGVRRYYREDGEIAVIVGTGNMTRKTFDEFVSALQDAISKRVATGLPVYIIGDVSNKDQELSNYARRKLSAFHDSLPDNVPVYGAMIVPMTVMAQDTTMYVESLLRMTSKRVEARMFTNLEPAIAWLNEMRARSQR